MHLFLMWLKLFSTIIVLIFGVIVVLVVVVRAILVFIDIATAEVVSDDKALFEASERERQEQKQEDKLGCF